MARTWHLRRINGLSQQPRVLYVYLVNQPGTECFCLVGLRVYHPALHNSSILVSTFPTCVFVIVTEIPLHRALLIES
jgi:hypothetical protein